MEKLVTPQVKAMLASYGRSLIGAGFAAYTASGGDVKAVANAIWAAALPVLMRYFNSADAAFGRTAEKK
jgi:hypothetical protein